MLDYLYDDNGLGLKFDGIWLDMNEAENSCNGYCLESERPKNSIKNKIPYVPGWRDLEDGLMGIDAIQNNTYTQYD
jgi:alpha-glucosidase (family GH31 glycosyl hydrolase)